MQTRIFLSGASATACRPRNGTRPGKPDIIERAEARKREILTTHYPDLIPRAVDERIRAKHDIKLPRAVMEPGDPRWTRI